MMVLLELLERRDQWVPQGQLDLQDQKDPMDPQERMGYLDMQAHEESQVFKAKQVFQDQLELLDHRASQVRLVQWENEVIQGHQDLQENMDCQVQPEGKELREILVLLAILVKLDLKGFEGFQAQEESQEKEVQLG